MAQTVRYVSLEVVVLKEHELMASKHTNAGEYLLRILLGRSKSLKMAISFKAKAQHLLGFSVHNLFL